MPSSFAGWPMIRPQNSGVLSLPPREGIIHGVSDFHVQRPLRVEASYFFFGQALADVSRREFFALWTQFLAFHPCLALTGELIPVEAILALIFVFFVRTDPPPTQ